jgi:hypothetical protein
MVTRYTLGHQIKRKDFRESDIVKLTAAARDGGACGGGVEGVALPWLQKGYDAPAGRARAEDQPEAGLASAARARIAGIKKEWQETACVEEGGSAPECESRQRRA